jgi:sugar-phosphatase
MAGLPEPRVLVTAEDTVRGKPDPMGYRLAAERLGFDPVDCVGVEDSPGGVRATLDAGMFAIAVETTHARDELAHARVVLASLAALRIAVRAGGLAVAW